MKHIKIRKSVIIAVALSGIAVNAGYCINLLGKLLSPQYDDAIREVMVSATALEIGWMILLLWLIFKPFERRFILLLTIPPVLFGNLLHGAIQFWNHSASMSSIALNTVFGFLYAGWYVVAFIAGKGGNNRA